MRSKFVPVEFKSSFLQELQIILDLAVLRKLSLQRTLILQDYGFCRKLSRLFLFHFRLKRTTYYLGYLLIVMIYLKKSNLFEKLIIIKFVEMFRINRLLTDGCIEASDVTISTP